MQLPNIREFWFLRPVWFGGYAAEISIELHNIIGTRVMIRAIKFLMHNIFHNIFRTKTRANMLGLSCIFNTESPALYKRVKYLGGEKEQLELFLKKVNPGDIVWDVGSFVGMFSVFSSKKVGSIGKVYAFEPEKKTAKLLQSNCEINNTRNIKIMNFALSNENKKGKIFQANEGQNAIHSLVHHESLDSQGVEIYLRTGDDLVAEGKAEIPDVIKLDVEGAEFQALQGMKTILENRKCRFLFLELHHADLPRFSATPEQVVSLITDSGFKITKEMKRGTESHLFCEK